VPMVSEMILRHAADLGVDPHGLKRLWLHQANINMNEMIGRRVLGRDPKPDENVIILNEYANTSSAGSIIAFHKHSEDLAAGDLGLICSFGAGYSAGTVFVRKRKRREVRAVYAACVQSHAGNRFLYASCECRYRLVNLSLTLSSAFLLLKDFHRNRLAGRLTRLQPAPTLDKSGKNTERDAVAAACAAAVPAARRR
jgi:3-Oxoacyl-[acyl-carrier-protein (ACP)] synthase III C terminal